MWLNDILRNLIEAGKDIIGIEKPENHGVLIPKIKSSDYVSGWFSKISYEERCSDWGKYLPTRENQFSSVADFQSCVSESFNSAIETQMIWMIKTGKFTTEQLDEMKELHYFDDNGQPNFSDRFLAKMSGTTRYGNSQNKVADTAKEYGLIGEKDWGETPNISFDEFYSEIPVHIKQKAKRIFDYINIGNKADSKGVEVERKGGYEWVVAEDSPKERYRIVNQILEKELLHAPIQVTVPLCPSYKLRQNGEVVGTCALINPAHALLLYGMKDDDGKLNRLIFDSYPPYNIVLENTYPLPYGLKIVATAVERKELRTITTDNGVVHTSETPSFWARFKSWLDKWGVGYKEKVGDDKTKGSIGWYE